MKKLLLFIGLILFLPISANASTNSEFIEVSSKTKYFRVTTYNNNLSLFSRSGLNSVIEEISEEEYENVSDTRIVPQTASTETTYKKLTTSIQTNGSKYRYSLLMNWKLMPSTRSYDIIGIGFYPSVKVSGNLHFTMNYKNSSGTYTSSTGTPYISNSGASMIFKLPSGNLNSLDAKLYFDVVKNTDATVITQKAYGDYSHAIKNISLENAKKHTVNTNGIVLNNSINEYYDSISAATDVWNGNW